jgi:hypothetical protein
MLERCALWADPVCCFVELAVNFFVQSFMLPCCAIAFNDFSGTNIGMRFRSVITDTDCYIVMERANHCRARRRQRISNDRSEIVGPAIDGHKRPLSASSRDDGPCEIAAVPICKLYSITTNQAAIIALFRAINHNVGAGLVALHSDYDSLEVAG